MLPPSCAQENLSAEWLCEAPALSLANRELMQAHMKPSRYQAQPCSQYQLQPTSQLGPHDSTSTLHTEWALEPECEAPFGQVTPLNTPRLAILSTTHSSGWLPAGARVRTWQQVGSGDATAVGTDRILSAATCGPKHVYIKNKLETGMLSIALGTHRAST